ncbi:MAG: hypothetical protein SNJ82_01090 [Gemmataceae bacterium]
MFCVRQLLWASLGVTTLWLTGCATPLFERGPCGERQGLFSRLGLRRTPMECCPPLVGTSLSTPLPVGTLPPCDCQGGISPTGPIIGSPVSGGVPIDGPLLPGIPPAMSTLPPPPAGTLPAPSMVPGEARPTPAGPSSLGKRS